MSEKTPILALRGWRVSRGATLNLGPLDVTVNAGEILTIMGPSGVGKTTAMLGILGYRESGVIVEGERYDAGRLLRPGEIPKGALLIPQGLPFNPNWEVAAYLRKLASASRRNGSRWTSDKVVRHVLAELGLGHRARATISELSGGEAQRAGLAQMLVLGLQGALRLVAGDEPVTALDPGLARWVLDEFRDIVQRRGCGAVLSLHDVHGALHVSNSILLAWPSCARQTPWHLLPGSAFWDPDVLHTLLCVGRWVSDLSPSPEMHCLLAALRAEFKTAEADSPPGWIIEPARGAVGCQRRPLDARISSAIVESSRIAAAQRVAPVRMERDRNRIFLGAVHRTNRGCRAMVAELSRGQSA